MKLCTQARLTCATDPELAGHLFELVNLIADQMITQPKKRATIYAKLSPKKLEAIERRDAKGKEGAGTE